MPARCANAARAALLLVGAALGAVPVAAQHGAAEYKGDVPLYENLGNWQHKVSTRAPLAQRYFDQGLRLAYGFNHDEAVRSFLAAAEIDPNCAMAHWGASLALGPNYNMGLDPDRAARAWAELREAQRLAEGATPAERRYIDALALRYSPEANAERGPLDRAYAEAMTALAGDYPDDVDALVLAAEARMNLRPWALWTREGHAEPGTEEIVEQLESALQRAPRHPGALHFLIHALEASSQPRRALQAADTLRTLAPGAGHLVHMPAHIYLRTGRLGDAVDCNAEAIAADREYFALRPEDGIFRLMYHPHNIQFRWYVQCLLGRSGDALRTADDLAAALKPEWIDRMPMIEAFVPARQLTHLRFGRWAEVLACPAPPESQSFASGAYRYASGVAHLKLGDKAAAAWNLRQLRKIRAAMSADRPLLGHKATEVLAIGEYDLAARLAEAAGEPFVAEGYFRQAIAAQDALLYDEPPPWFRPQRQALGMFLVRQGRAAEATPLFESGLQMFPDNGWDLFGLAEVRRASPEADTDAADTAFRRAWSTADAEIQAAWY